MDKLTKEVFERGIKFIELILPKRKYSKEQLELYYILLKDIDDTTFMEGIHSLLKTYKWDKLPTPADILDNCRCINEEKETIRYYNIRQQIRQITRYPELGYITDDPLTHIAINKLGGAMRLGDMLSTEVDRIMDTQLKEVLNSFSKIKNTDIPLIIGNPNSEHLVLIGDKELIKKWIGAYSKNKYNVDFTKLLVNKSINENGNAIVTRETVLENKLRRIAERLEFIMNCKEDDMI